MDLWRQEILIKAALFVASILPVRGREAEPEEPIAQETSRAREAGQLGEAWSWFTGSVRPWLAALPKASLSICTVGRRWDLSVPFQLCLSSSSHPSVSPELLWHGRQWQGERGRWSGELEGRGWRVAPMHREPWDSFSLGLDLFIYGIGRLD